MLKQNIDLLQEVIFTSRLKMIAVSFEFTGEIFNEFTEYVSKYIYPRSYSDIRDARDLVKAQIESMISRKSFQTVILDQNSNEFLGCAGLNYLDFFTPSFYIWLKEKAQSKGYGKGAIVGLKEWADKNITYDYLIYPVLQENVRSRRIPESMGAELAKGYGIYDKKGKMLNTLEYRIYPKNKIISENGNDCMDGSHYGIE